MRHLRNLTLVVLPLSVLACSRDARPTAGLDWAYPQGNATTFGRPLGQGPVSVPGSALVLTRAQMSAAEGPIDWFPQDHPPAPAVIGGHPPGKADPCAECHGYNGAGYPGSADLAGLPADYIIEQVNAFRSGDRRSAVANQPNTAEMIKVAKAVTPEELQAAARYFAGLPRTRWRRVVERTTVPRTVPDMYGWLDPAPGGGTEAIGDRIVELSDDLPTNFLGDDHVILTDYAPPGAVARGERIAATGGASGAPCSTCHGPRLNGLPPAPPIAGRPAGYVARTLWDLRVGARNNAGAAPMRSVAKQLSPSDIRDVSAYLASLRP